MPVITVSDGISKLSGTTNQVALSASGANALAGGNDIVLSTPQDIATTSNVTFGTATLGTPIVTAITPGTGITVNDAGSVREQTYKVTLTFAAFSAAAKTKDITIATLPAKAQITHLIADVTTAFTGGGESAATLKVGTTAGGVDLLASADVFTAAATLGLADADMGTALVRSAAIQGGYLGSFSATKIVNARITTTTNNTSTLTAGSVTFYITVRVLA